MSDTETEGHILVDLDGTLAHAEEGDFKLNGPEYIGAPIPAMVARVRKWLDDGKEVKIFTARVAEKNPRLLAPIIAAIEKWSRAHIGETLEITCIKDSDAKEIWDDRAVRVTRNSGEPCCDGKKRMTVTEAGRKGGKANMAKHGVDFYKAIGRKGGESVKESHGTAFYSEIGKKGGDLIKASAPAGFYEELGKKGGNTIKAKHPEQFAEMGKKGGASVRRLVAAGKKVEEGGE